MCIARILRLSFNHQGTKRTRKCDVKIKLYGEWLEFIRQQVGDGFDLGVDLFGYGGWWRGRMKFEKESVRFLPASSCLPRKVTTWWMDSRNWGVELRMDCSTSE